MKGKSGTRFTLFAAGAVSTVLAWSSSALAQCAMCKNAVTGSPEAVKLSQSLNFAILILLVPPVLIFCGIFVVAYRHRKSRGTVAAEAQSLSEDEGGQGTGLANSVKRRKKNGTEREAGGALA